MKRVLPIFLTFFVLTFVFPGKIFAACEKKDPDFHSLRPYPANPCQTNVDSYAKFCGNNLTLHDTINETYPGNGDCKSVNGTITCTYNEPVDEKITIDLSIASLPIMGNTEDVTNSKNASAGSDILNDTEKVNNYVSWYLNGVNYRAEYGNTKTDAESLVNFSGPIQKLLPGAILDNQRIQTINNAGSTNHNQMVVCADRAIQLPSWLSWIPVIGKEGIGKSTPVPCYGGESLYRGRNQYRLEDWKNDITLKTEIQDALKDAVSKFLEGSGNLAAELVNKAFLDRWDKKMPPLPWSDKNSKPFATSQDYQKAYNEWRGDLCAFLPSPLGGKDLLLCVGIPGVTNNEFADLYPYVPLSGTEDLTGAVSVDSVSSATNPATTGVTVQNVTFSGQKPATLFFAHMQESDELANLLQTTFVAKNLSPNGNPTDVASGVSCNTVEVRSNKGDNLFANPNQIDGDLSYNATFSCNFKPPTNNCMQDCLAKGNITSYCGSYCSIPGNAKASTQTCSKDIYISLSTISSTPKVDDIWSRLVAGPASVFKRIFPKTNTEGGIGQIMDIPGSTNITYSGTKIGQSNTDIKFPHIGGVSEYFLKGIQTILKPKGYGESIIFAPATEGKAIDCDKNAPDVSLKNTLNKQDYYQLALRWVGSETGTKALECYNDTVRKAQEAGVNPTFALLIWLHESDASNYNISTMDFGANYPAPAGFVGQINEFFARAKNYTVNDTRCNWSNLPLNQKDNMHVFAWIYRNGRCDPNFVNPEGETGEQYYQNLSDQWKLITTCPFPKSPTDTSCP
jgi:hypothetical protein